MSDAQNPDTRPPHPFWCDECGAGSGFRIKGCVIDHETECSRYGETTKDAERNWETAIAWLVRHPGERIP